MIRTRDFRPDATNLSRVVNARARRDNKPNVVELDTDEFVHIHCGDAIFIVFRDVITAGSMYFESCLFGFFKEAYSQEITFAEDVSPDALELYLNLTHSWFFEIRFRGIRVVPADYFRSLIEAIQEEPFRKAHLEIPKMKLRELAEVATLADRFLHRSLLCILRQMFLSLLNITHVSWGNIKQEARDLDVLYHAEFVFDYTDAFEILSMGHDDEKYLRNALTESFHWLTLNTPDIKERFLYLMSEDFINECDQDRRGHSETEHFAHAKGIFATDQFCYESVTRVQKQRRYKRVVNMCPFEDQKDVFPWVENPRDRRIRVRRLHNSVRAINRSTRDARNQEYRFGSFVPGAASRQALPFDSYNQSADDGREVDNKNLRLRGAVCSRGRGRGRGGGRELGGSEHGLSRGRHHHRPTSTKHHGSQLQTPKIDPEGDRTLQTGGGGHSLTMNHDVRLPLIAKSMLPSNQANKWSSVGLNPETQAFKQPSQVDSMIRSIRALVSTGKHNTLGYLEKQGKHATQSQQQGQFRGSEGQSNQDTFPDQPSQSYTHKIQKFHAQQPQSQRILETNDQGPSQKSNKSRKKKKKKSYEASATAQGTGKPIDDITISSVRNTHQTENISKALKGGNANTGSVDVAKEAHHSATSVSAAPAASNTTSHLPDDTKRQVERESHVVENINGEKGRGRRYPKGRGNTPENDLKKV